MIERKITKQLLNNIKTNDILILVGARQVGKTTVLKDIKNRLDKQGDLTSFLSLEDPALLEDLNIHPNNIFSFVREPQNNERLYLFIDEIQYLNNPSNFLKYMYDFYADKIKLIVTGSSAFYIDKKFKDSLAGRKKIFKLYGFSFSEFLLAKNRKDLAILISKDNYFLRGKKISFLKTEKNDLKRFFLEYSTYGSYPRVVLTNDTFEKKELLQELSNSFLKKDIYDAKIENQAKFYKLIKILASQVGNLLNINELANTLNLSQNTLAKYIYVLEKSFIVNLVSPFYKNIRKELTKMPKVFFVDIGFRNSLVNYFESFIDGVDAGAKFKNIFYIELIKQNINIINFWRTQNKSEVDFVVDEKYAFELKLNKAKFKLNKYNIFIKNYETINFQPVISFDKEYLDILDFVS